MIVECLSERFQKQSSALLSLLEGWSDSSLHLHTQYTVYGVGIYKGTPKILIDPSKLYKPFWYSSLHFRIIDNKLPSFWKISVSEDEWSLLIGYDELVNSIAHFDGVLNRDIDDISLFQSIAAIHEQSQAVD